MKIKILKFLLIFLEEKLFIERKIYVPTKATNCNEHWHVIVFFKHVLHPRHLLRHHLDINFSFFVSPDFHELWRSIMHNCLITEVKQQWATLALGWVNPSGHY